MRKAGEISCKMIYSYVVARDRSFDSLSLSANQLYWKRLKEKRSFQDYYLFRFFFLCRFLWMCGSCNGCSSQGELRGPISNSRFINVHKKYPPERFKSLGRWTHPSRRELRLVQIYIPWRRETFNCRHFIFCLLSFLLPFSWEELKFFANCGMMSSSVSFRNDYSI